MNQQSERRTEHTPGPWVGFNDEGSLFSIMPAGRDGDICRFAVSPSDADGSLMIAAPDLLDALKIAVGHIEHMAAWITAMNGKQPTTATIYSFESLGEDMPTIRENLTWGNEHATNTAANSGA